MSTLSIEAAVIKNPYIFFALGEGLFLQYLYANKSYLGCERILADLSVFLSIVDIEGGGNEKNIEIIECYNFVKFCWVY